MNAQDLFAAGRLSETIAAVTEEVKKKPMDVHKRGFLCELLIVARDWERADKQLDFIGHQNPDAMMTVAMWRQLIRAGQCRDQFYAEGRIPEVLEEPDELLQAYLKASVLMREGNKKEAGIILDAAEPERTILKGTVNGVAFDDFRDLDDLSPGVLEVFTSNGKYYWIRFSRIQSLEFHAPKSTVDLVLRRATLQTTNNGPEGDVYIPAIYPTLTKENRDMLLLGKATDWLGEEGEPVVGVGLRMFYVNDEARSIMEINEVEFEQ